MYSFPLARYEAAVRQVLGSLIYASLAVPVVVALMSIILIALLATLAGLPALEYALDSVDDAAAQATLVSAQFLLIAYFISAACFAFSGNWAGMPVCQLVDRLYIKISGLVRLWSSSMSAIATPLRSPDEAYRPIPYCGRLNTQRGSFLFGETPQLE